MTRDKTAQVFAEAAFKEWGGDAHQWEAFNAGYAARLRAPEEVEAGSKGSDDVQLDAVMSTAAIAWGWLWHVTTADDRVKTARHLLGQMLDKNLKRYGIQTAKAEGAQVNMQGIDTAPPSAPVVAMADDARVPGDYRNQASGYRAGWNDALACRPSAPVGTDANELAGVRARLKSGDYDGADVMKAWLAIDKLLAQQPALSPVEIRKGVGYWKERADILQQRLDVLDAQQPAATKDTDLEQLIAQAVRGTGHVSNSDKWDVAEAVMKVLPAQQPAAVDGAMVERAREAYYDAAKVEDGVFTDPAAMRAALEAALAVQPAAVDGGDAVTRMCEAYYGFQFSYTKGARDKMRRLLHAALAGQQPAPPSAPVGVGVAVNALMANAHIVQQALAMHVARAESDISKPALFSGEKARRAELSAYLGLIQKASDDFRALHLAWSKS